RADERLGGVFVAPEAAQRQRQVVPGQRLVRLHADAGLEDARRALQVARLESLQAVAGKLGDLVRSPLVGKDLAGWGAFAGLRTRRRRLGFGTRTATHDASRTAARTCGPGCLQAFAAGRRLVTRIRRPD